MTEDSQLLDPIEAVEHLLAVESPAEKIHKKHDGQKIKSLVQELPQAERLVIEMSFGLSTGEVIATSAIAIKLGRTESWVERRLAAGINQLRRQCGV